MNKKKTLLIVIIAAIVGVQFINRKKTGAASA